MEVEYEFPVLLKKKKLDELEGVLNICLVGDGVIGKTSFISAFINHKFPRVYVPTVFENDLVEWVVDGRKIFISLWDTAGQEDYDHLRRLSYKAIDIFFVCFSVVNPSSLKAVESKWVPEIMYCPKAQYFLVGLKTDLRDDDTTLKRLAEKHLHPISPEEGLIVAQNNGAVKYFECSALTGRGLSEIIREATRLTSMEKKEYKKTNSYSILNTIQYIIRFLKIKSSTSKVNKEYSKTMDIKPNDPPINILEEDITSLNKLNSKIQEPPSSPRYRKLRKSFNLTNNKDKKDEKNNNKNENTDDKNNNINHNNNNNHINTENHSNNNQIIYNNIEYKDKSTIHTTTLQLSSTQINNTSFDSHQTNNKHTFSNSNFNRQYISCRVPEWAHQILSSVYNIIYHYCNKSNIPIQEASKLFKSLESHILQNTSNLSITCMQIWTSGETLCDKEFCTILNHVIRQDDSTIMSDIVTFSRGLNTLLCTHRNHRCEPIRWPNDNELYRGGGLPDDKKFFFKKGVTYRCPMYLATSRNQNTSKSRFCSRASAGGLPPVMWVIRLDSQYHTWHVNYVEHTLIPGEDEFLFVPYSVFVVEEVEWKDNPTWQEPHLVWLRAAVDNKMYPEDLPLSPWN